MTSARLPSGTVRNRAFPKTRSWFALGLPVGLLSRLSVVRILYVLLAVVWPLTVIAFDPTRSVRWTVLAVSAAAIVVWLGLIRVRSLGLVRCQVLLVMALIGAAVAGRTAHTDAISIVYLTFAAPVGAAGGLFLRFRPLAFLHVVMALTLWWAVSPLTHPGAGLALAGLASFALLAATATVALLTRAIQRQDGVDADTGLPNGPGLAALVRAGDFRDSYIVTIVSLAGLSDVREALGYQVGTEVLRRAVEDLGQVVPSQAVLGRVDGDELVVLMPFTCAVEEAPSPGIAGRPAGDLRRTEALVAATETGQATATMLAEAVSAGRYLVGGIELSLRAYAGVAIAPWDGDDVVALVRRASLSARRAVASGQRARVWDGERDAMTADDLALLTELRLAPDRGELWLAYQPQVDVRSSRTESVEALIRWQSPTRGSVGPDIFIPLAERTGLIDRLTDWVLDEALDAQVRWRASGVDLNVSVNVSAKSLSRPDLPEWILTKLADRSLTPTCLTVEVTETAETADLLQAIGNLRPLRESGIRVSIDDFGTGYTSLSVLPHLPLDELKVDRGFVMRSGTSAADEAIVRSICELAHHLGLIAVAEGVEDDECRRRLAEYNFDLLQGYYLSRPLAEPALLAFVAEVTGAASAGQASALS